MQRADYKLHADFQLHKVGAPNAHIVQGSTVDLKSPHDKKKKIFCNYVW